MPVSTSTELTVLHTRMKSAIEAVQPFRYVDASKWVQFDLGVFPDSLKNQSYTIKYSSSEVSDVDAVTDVLKVDIEFVLDTLHDGYLKYLPRCQEAVFGIQSDSGIFLGESVVTYRDFETIYFFDKVMIAFSIEIYSNIHH